MAAESRPRLNLRTTIPMAAETLIRRVGRPRRSWLIPFLTLGTGLLFAGLLLELMFSLGPVSALAYEGELRSRLVADYSQDPAGSQIFELRLSIAEEVFGPNPRRAAGGDESARAPVPTVTPEPTDAPPHATATHPPHAQTEIAATAKALEAMTTTPAADTVTPAPSTTSAASILDCAKLYVKEAWFASDDEVRVRIQNNLPKDAYLSHAVLAWPDLPPPAYVDYFRFDDDRYYQEDDHSSPTSASSWERLRKGDSEVWRADFDDEPDDGIYGAFSVTLTFEVPAMSGSCTLSANLFKPIPPGPVPTAVPSVTPLPPTATPTKTAAPSATPSPSATTAPTATVGMMGSTVTPETTGVPAADPTATASPEPSPTPTED